MGLVSSVSAALCCACSGLSCACSLAGCCCSVASTAAGGISNTAAKYFNLLLLGLVTAVCLVLRFYADDWSWSVAGWDVTLCSAVGNETSIDPTGTYDYYAYCKGDAAVYRASAATQTYFALMMLLCLCGTGFHRGFWAWKLILLFGGIVGFMFIPPESFDVDAYIWTSRIFSVVFLLIQLFLVLGFAYDWNDKWVDNAYAEGGNEKGWLCAVLICSLLLYVVAFVGVGFLYAGYASCSVGSAVITVTLLSIIAFTGLTLFRDRLTGQEGAVLPAAVVAAYVTYMAWSALDSNTDAACKPFPVGESDQVGEGGGSVIVISILIAALSMMWVANQSSGSAVSFLTGGKGHTESGAGAQSQPPELVYEVGEGRTAEDMRRQQTGAAPAPAKPDPEGLSDAANVATFYFVLIVTTMYMSMVVTNWGAAEETTPEGAGKGQMWVKIASQWMTIALFVWTLIAPAVLKGREFGPTPAAVRGGSRSSGPASYGTSDVARV